MKHKDDANRPYGRHFNPKIGGRGDVSLSGHKLSECPDRIEDNSSHKNSIYVIFFFQKVNDCSYG
jgi:hypothetical protein